MLEGATKPKGFFTTKGLENTTDYFPANKATPRAVNVQATKRKGESKAGV